MGVNKPKNTQQMKYGNAIPKKTIRIEDKDFLPLIGAMAAFGRENGMWHDYEAKKPIHEHDDDEGGFEHVWRYMPRTWDYRECKHGTYRPSTLRVNPTFKPILIVYIELCKSQIEGTDEWVNQYQMFVRTANLQERGYRHKRWEVFSGYKSFDYDTDINEIIKSATESLQQIVDAYRPIF